MARSTRLRRKEYVVYLDDVMDEVVDPESGEPVLVGYRDPKTGEMAKDGNGEPILKPKQVETCKAFEVEGESPPEEGCSLFKLRSIPLNEALEAGNLAARGEAAEAALTVLKKALTGWDNVAGPDGEPIEFSSEALDYLDMEEAMALAGFVMEKTTGKVRVKNRRQLGNV